jgi:hypothetical protein
MKRGIIYILLILVCIYIGIINREEAYFYVAALMLAVMVCLLVGLFTRFFRTGISMQMNIPVVEKNRTFHPELTVRSKSGQVPYVSAVFKVMAAGMKKKQNSTFRQIDNENGVCQGAMSLAVSGRYEIAAADVRVYDAFHMFYIKKKIKNSANVYVLPQCYLMPINITKKTRDFVTDSDVYHADIRGDDSSEVYQVREYRPGDSVRNIHWKLTARQDEIMVRDMNKTLSCPVIICVNLDGKDCKNYGHAMSAALESMVSLSFSLIDIRVPHFIAWYDPEKMSITRYRIIKEEDVYDAAARMSYVDARSMDWYDVIGMYREKYRGEDFTSFIDVDMKGNIQCGDDRYHVKFETLKEDLTHMCLTV